MYYNFSHVIEESVIKKYNPEFIGNLKCATGLVPVYKINYNNKVFAFYKTYISAPAAVGLLEDVTEIIDTKKYIVFGGAGSLDKEISYGKVMIPTEAYRDEGTSYHYIKPSDQAVCDFRNLELYYFLASGDLLDAPIWDPRKKENDLTGTQHDVIHFDIALSLALYITNTIE